MALGPPNALRLCLESGLRAQAQGDIAAAAGAYKEALRLAPEHPDALNLMGTALLQLGRANEAVDHLTRAARKMKNYPAVHGNLGQAYVAVGRYEQAREAFRKASRLDPGNVYYRLGIAGALAMQGKLDEAERLLRKQAERFANEPLVWFNLGNVLRDQGRPAEALDCFTEALRLNPAHLEARNNRGGVLHALQRFDEAEREYRACIEAAPDHVPARCNLALLLTVVGRFSEAEATLRRVLELAPDLHEVYIWLGTALNQQGRVGEATACFRAAAERAPQDARAVQACALGLMNQGRAREGLRWFTRALSRDSSEPLRASLCAALLTEGQLSEGWAEHDARPAAVRIRQLEPDLPLARELPAVLAGRHVCLVREQGLGDEIFFLRFAAELRSRGARMTYRASDKLHGLLARAAIVDEVLAQDAELPTADATFLIGDLPHALRALPAEPLAAVSTSDGTPAIPDFPQRIAIFWPELPASIRLMPLSAQATAVRERLAEAGPPPYLGITWQAGTPPRLQKGADWVLHKAIAPKLLGTALRGIPGTLIALQRRPAPGELEVLAAAAGQPVHDFTAVNEDLEAMLALLAVIDEYLGVSNTNTHLRAAAGRTARVLVPCPPEWRWMRIGRASIWFPGFTIYRQSLDGAWDTALGELRQDLDRTRN